VRAVADVTKGVVHASVDVEAPPEAVWDALTEPEQLSAWWGANLYRTFNWQFDLRPGGRWSVDTMGDGGPNHVRGEILEVDRPRRLVLTWEASWDGFCRTVITYSFVATATGTRLTIVHTGFEGRPQACEGHAIGWDAVLGWMAAHLSRSAGNA
jgi:uncharacterized protein YndB with AHSA1/START domain